jgi:hypothetical protein
MYLPSRCQNSSLEAKYPNLRGWGTITRIGTIKLNTGKSHLKEGYYPKSHEETRVNRAETRKKTLTSPKRDIQGRGPDSNRRHHVGSLNMPIRPLWYRNLTI